jgi:hypothetical protein
VNPNLTAVKPQMRCGRSTQSRFLSFVEAAANIVVGYAVAVLTQVMAFPLFGLHATLSDNLLIGGIFTCASLVRSYALRRLFNSRGVR